MKKAKGNDDIPIGLGIELARNLPAMENFSRMGDTERAILIKTARNAKSKQEMAECVQNIAEGHMPESV